jgi:hypothetical protein
LITVVVVDKGLYGLDGCVDCPGAEQRGQGAGDKPGKLPNWQEAAVVRFGQPGLDELQVLLFCGQVVLSKGLESGVAGKSQHPLVNADCAYLASMVSPQISQHPFRK